MENAPVPGPLIETFVEMGDSDPLVRVIVPVVKIFTLFDVAPEALAPSMAARSDPAPESLVFVTVKSSAMA